MNSDMLHTEFSEQPGLERVPGEPYPELPFVLGELVAGVKDELAGDLVGVYLVGSLATGGFDLDSDVDFLVVTENELTEEAVRSLQKMHTRIHGIDCYPAKHLEGSYISRDVLKRPETVGVQPLWYLDNGSTTFERSLHDNKWHVRQVLRERGIPLFGPDPAKLLDPVPIEALRAEISEMMHRIADLFGADIDGPLTYWNSRFGQSYTMLTYCRMLHTLQTGVVQSKLAGMKWAAESLSTAWTGFIQQAWKEREGVRFCVKIRQRADTKALGETLKFIKYALRQIEEYYPAEPEQNATLNKEPDDRATR